VRSLLNREGIPNIVQREGGRLVVKTPSAAESLGEPIKVQNSIDSYTLARLANSAIRLKLRQEGWKTTTMKVFNAEKYNKLLEDGSIRQYNAYKLSMHYFENLGCYILSVDPTFKYETFLTLSNLSRDVLTSIKRVKLCGEYYSFELIGIEENSQEAMQLARKTLEALQSKFTVQISMAKEIVAKVYPLNKQLRDFLMHYSLLLKETQTGINVYYTFIPTDALCALPSVDNLKKLGVDLSEHRMWKSPNKRYQEAIDFAKNIEVIETEGLKLELATREPVRVKTQDVLRPQAQTSNHTLIRLDDVVDPSAWGDRITPIQNGSNIRVALINNNEKIMENIVTLLGKHVAKWLKRITNTNASTEMVDGIEEAKDDNFNALIYIGHGDEQTYAKIEYKVATLGLIPQFIDGDKLYERLKLPSKRTFKVENYAFPIAKSLAFRAGWRYLSLTPPPGLEDAVIAGIDRTYAHVGNGIGVGVVPVLMSPDGLKIGYLDPILGGGEEEIMVNATSRLREQLGRFNSDIDTLVLLVNSTNIPKEIEEILEKNFPGYVIASVTKTHSYSRLLRKQDGMYVNPWVGDYIVINEDDTTGSYLVSTSDLRKSSDRTITPLLIHLKIRGLKVKPRTVLKYLLDMQTLNIEGAYFPASIPWPLYRADKLCKKLYNITLYTRQLPSGKILEVL
jgi:hypothetical protein